MDLRKMGLTAVTAFASATGGLGTLVGLFWLYFALGDLMHPLSDGPWSLVGIIFTVPLCIVTTLLALFLRTLQTGSRRVAARLTALSAFVNGLAIAAQFLAREVSDRY